MAKLQQSYICSMISVVIKLKTDVPNIYAMKKCIVKKCRLRRNDLSSWQTVRYYTSEKKESNSYKIENWGLMIVRSGTVIIEIDSVCTSLNTNDMFIIPVNRRVKISLEESTKICYLFFYDQLSFCNRTFIDDMTNKTAKSGISKQAQTLKLHPYIEQAVDFTESIYQDKNLCSYMEKIFINQLMVLIRYYYNDEELFSFFKAMEVKNIDFKSYILLNYDNKDIQTLANECNMSIPTFNRYFRNSFGESPLQWLNKKKAYAIYQELITSAKPFAEVAYDNNFSSAAYLTAFCKRYFCLSPEQIRRRSKE